MPKRIFNIDFSKRIFSFLPNRNFHVNCLNSCQMERTGWNSTETLLMAWIHRSELHVCRPVVFQIRWCFWFYCWMVTSLVLDSLYWVLVLLVKTLRWLTFQLIIALHSMNRRTSKKVNPLYWHIQRMPWSFGLRFISEIQTKNYRFIHRQHVGQFETCGCDTEYASMR